MAFRGRWKFGFTLTGAFAIPVMLALHLGALRDLPVFGVSAILTLALAARGARTLGWATTSIIALEIVPPLLFVAGVLMYPTIDWPIPQDGAVPCLVALPLVCTASVGAGVAMAGFLGRLDARKRERIISGSAHALAVLAAVSVVLSAVKPVRHPDQVLAGLEYVGTFPDSRGEISTGDPPLLIDKGAVHISGHLRPASSGCTITVADNGRGVSGEFVYSPDGPVGCIGVAILRVPALGLWIATCGLDRHFWHGQLTYGYLEPTFAPHETTLLAFRQDIAPPLSWTCVAAVGVCAGIALLARRNRRLLTLQRWREEELGGVTVLVNPAAPPPTYRSALRLDDPAYVETTLAAVQHELSEWNTGRSAFALAVMATTSAPLAAACLLGFA